jgi:multimeric flavodoxin WrbA
MKILGISFSPNKDGNTIALVKKVLEGSKEEGADTELYSVSGKNIHPCQGCRSCAETGICEIDDDMQDLYSKMLEADGIIFGTPIYVYNMTAAAKAVIERTIAFCKPEKSLANKVGSVVAVAGSFGLINAVKDLYLYMVTRQIIPANYVAAYAETRGKVTELEKCMKAANLLGHQMVKIAVQGFKYPPDIARPSFAYGTHHR